MSTPLVDCPSDDLLAKYLDDGLSPTVSGPLTLHIDECQTCQAKLDTIVGDGKVSDRLRALSSSILRGASPDSTFDRGVVATTANDTQMFGRDGIPMVPRVHVTRPMVPGYEVEGEIGRGGMGVVFKAQHKRLNRTVALKMVLAAGVADPRVTQRFMFEAEVLARVQHPQVVQVYEVNMFTAPTGVVFPYLAMELLPGGSLLQWASGRTIAPNEAAEQIEGLARAVHAVHLQGIVHRDLKPANILRSAEGVFKVTDFGLAKLTAESGAQLTGTGMVVGTPAYMAPEQAGGEGPIGPPADVYSLGAMLFELLAGRPPFPGDDAMSVLLKVVRDPAPDIRTFRPDMPRDLAAVVMKCLTKEPARRYQSADDFADDLRRFLNRRPTRARTLSVVERAWYWARRNPAVATLVSSLAVVLIAGFVSTFILWQQAEREANKARQAAEVNKGLAQVAQKERETADGQRQEADKLRREADKSRAYLAFDQAVNRSQAGLPDVGLKGFVEALSLAERTGEMELARVIRENIAAWEREKYPAGLSIRPRQPSQAAAVSTDGTRLFTGDADFQLRMWDANTGELVGSFSPDELLVLAGRLKSSLLDPVINVPVSVVPGYTAVATDREGKWVAATTTHYYLMIWSTDGRVRQQIPIRSPHGRTPSLWAVSFDAAGRVWVGGDDDLLFAYDPKTGQHVANLHPPGSLPQNGLSALGGGPVAHFLRPLEPGTPPPDDGSVIPRRPVTSIMSLCPSPSDNRLFSGDRSGRLIEWDLDTGRAAVVYRFTGHQWVSAVCVSRDGKFVAGASTDGTARLWQRQRSTLPVVWDPPELWRVDLNGAYGRGVALSADGSRLVVGDRDGQVVAYDTRTRSPIGPALRRLNPSILAFLPDDARFLVGEATGVRLTRLPEPGHVPVPSGPPRPPSGHTVRFVDFRPDGGELLVGAGGLQVYDPADGHMLAVLPISEEPLCGRFSVDGTRVAYGCRYEWGVFAAATRKRLLRSSTSGYVSAIPARPTAEATTLVMKGYILSYATGTGKFLYGTKPASLTPPGVVLAGITGSADGAEWRVATSQSVEFLDVKTLRTARPLLTPDGEITQLAQTDDASAVAVLVEENLVEVYDPIKRERRAVIHIRHRETVTTVALSPNGRLLVTGSRDHTIQFWDVATGLPIGPRRKHAAPVTALVYAPDGKSVAVGTHDGTAVVWPVPPPPDATPLDELRQRYPLSIDNPLADNR